MEFNDISRYFDCNATTPISEDVSQNAPLWLKHFGNPSSIHWASRGPKAILREARQKLAVALGCHPLELIFTSGASESNNTVLKTYFKNGETHFLVSSVEHPSVMKTVRSFQALGAKVDFIPVSVDGKMDLDFFQEKLTEKTSLVSVMLANNETGHIFPIQQMVQMARRKNIPFHTDAVQALGKLPISLSDLGVDYASFSAHKFYALKGVGVLYSKKSKPLQNLIFGGAQERDRRGGTENIFGIAALGLMAEKLDQVSIMSAHVERLRNYMEERILSEISNVKITGHQSTRLPNTSSLVIDGIDGETLLMSLDLKGYAVSTGAACSSGNPEPSPVLLAMGLSRAQAQSSLRLSLGWHHDQKSVDEFVEVLKSVVQRLRSLEKEASVER